MHGAAAGCAGVQPDRHERGTDAGVASGTARRWVYGVVEDCFGVGQGTEGAGGAGQRVRLGLELVVIDCIFSRLLYCKLEHDEYLDVTISH